MIRKGDFSPGPLVSQNQFNFTWSGYIKPNKLEAKHLYYSIEYDNRDTRKKSPCLVVWSKEIERNIMIRGFDKMGMFLGVSAHGVAIPSDFVREGELQYLLKRLKIALRSSGDKWVSLVAGGSHPEEPLWFNGYELDVMIDEKHKSSK